MIERVLKRIEKKALEDPEWWTRERKMVISIYLWTLKRFINEGNSFEKSVRLTCEEIMYLGEK